MNSKIKFGKKKRHVLVPEGWVIMKPSDRLVLKEARNHRTGDLIYRQDAYLDLLEGKFKTLSRDDFEDIDGNEIETPIDFFGVLIRDSRAIHSGDEHYPVGTTLIYNEEEGIFVEEK